MEVTGEKPQDFSRMRAAMDVHYGICSLMSRELGAMAENLFETHKEVHDADLHIVYAPNDGPAEVSYNPVRLLPLVHVPATKERRELSLALIRPVNDESGTVEDIKLVAITRQNVAFPVVSFARRPDSVCDYVQIGEEAYDEAVVTSKDDVRRADLLVEVANLLKDPKAYEQELLEDQQELRHIVEYFKTKVADYLLANPNDPKTVLVERIKEKIEDLRGSNNRRVLKNGRQPRQDRGPSRLQRRSTLIGLLQSIGHARDQNDAEIDFAACGKADRELTRFFSRPDPAGIIDEIVPGSTSDEVKILLILHAAERSGVSYGEFLESYIKSSKLKLLTSTKVKERIDDQLGEFNPDAERIYKMLGGFAVSSTYTSNFRTPFIIDPDVNYPVETEFQVNVEASETEEYQTEILFKQVADHEKEGGSTHNHIIERAAPIRLGDVDVKELLHWLTKAQSAGFEEVVQAKEPPAVTVRTLFNPRISHSSMLYPERASVSKRRDPVTAAYTGGIANGELVHSELRDLFFEGMTKRAKEKIVLSCNEEKPKRIDWAGIFRGAVGLDRY